ncbi:MAG: hypothetical protein HDS59_07155 [Barnesiella sp.]|nr:hypothetical protein [Barnesiella sp.]
MKHLKFLFLVLIGLTFSTTVTSCKDDVKEPSKGLAGTIWKINSATEDDLYEGEDDEYEFVGTTVTFNSDGNVTFSKPNAWSYAKWSYTNDKLKIVLGEGEPDDYMEGSFVINGNKATYTYSWYDIDGDWGGKDEYVMILTKQ